MGTRTVQTIVGWLFVLGHFGIASLILFGKDATWTRDLKISAILTLMPVTVAYVTAVIISWVDGSGDTGPGDPVNFNFVAIAVLLPTMLFVFLIYTIMIFPSANFSQPEQLQQWLAGIEVVFGGTIGYLMRKLFKATPQATTPSKMPR